MTVLRVEPLGFPWKTADPFLFCVFHDDTYPAGNEHLGPDASLAGRELGSDFGRKDGWSMYHGEQVPGFPQHPHRGFETVTVVRRGLVDHADSLGAIARYGEGPDGRGDVQWLTAGRGICHAEMFPLRERERPNPLELFQIWLNLPPEDKMADPAFVMLWGETVPRVVVRDDAGRAAEVTVVAGRFGDATPPTPPPRSWASRPDTDVAIWTLMLEPGARATLPAAAAGSSRSLYYFRGAGLRVGGRDIPAAHRVEVKADATIDLENGPEASEVLVLQGRPIGKPVAQYGPFVMNTPAEIEQAFADYRRTGFGGWPWKDDAPVQPREDGRFARHPDGRIERGGA
jgi:redox-sensitive bicupin YhaK (pirin superfamily)